MGSILYRPRIISSPALELKWINIADVPVADASSVSDWNTFFDLPTNGSPFTSVEVVGDVIKLRGGSGITIISELEFGSILSVIDNAGCIETLGGSAFDTLGLLEIVKLPACISIGFSVFAFDTLKILELDSIESLNSAPFNFFATNLESIYIPNVTNLGGTVLEDGVFGTISDGIFTLTISASLMTCNGGNPDGDIQRLTTYNTVTIFDIDNNQIYP